MRFGQFLHVHFKEKPGGVEFFMHLYIAYLLSTFVFIAISSDMGLFTRFDITFEQTEVVAVLSYRSPLHAPRRPPGHITFVLVAIIPRAASERKHGYRGDSASVDIAL